MSIPQTVRVVDFHIHAFPDRIAARTIENLAQISNTEPATDGTAAGTSRYLRENGIDLGVLMQIATNPKQQTNVNLWAAEVQQAFPNIICFGSVHPDAPNVLEELKHIKELGLYGVKLHPDYQNFMVNDPKMDSVYQALSDLALPVTLHTGKDPYSPNLVHAPAKGIAEICQRFPKLTVIAAHLGGLDDYDEAEKYLVGKNLYLDCSLAPNRCSWKQMKRIIQNHGADKILFATDSPWSYAGEALSFFRSCDLTPTEKEQILHKNAEALLHICEKNFT